MSVRPDVDDLKKSDLEDCRRQVTNRFIVAFRNIDQAGKLRASLHVDPVSHQR